MNQFTAQFVSAAAIGALSPVATMATIAVLTAPRHALRNALLLLFGWSLVLIALAAFVRAVLGAGGGGLADSTKAMLNLILGMVLISFGLRQLIASHHPLAQVAAGAAKEAMQAPGWIRTLDHLTALRAFAVGAALILISPPDIAVYLNALQGLETAGSNRVLLNGVLVAAIDLCILIPLAVSVLMPRRAARLLAAGRVWLLAHLKQVSAWSLLGFGILLTVTGAVHLLT